MGVPMTKRVQEVALGTRTARVKLTPRHKPYFRLVEEGVHLGYRRATVAGRAGTWLGRRYLGSQRYETEILGPADDLPAAPEGVTPLSYDDAVRAAREWARRRAAASRAAAAVEGTVTVRRAIADYIAVRITRSARAGRDAELRLGHHVLAAPLADVALVNLTEHDLSHWRDGLRRGGRGAGEKAAPIAPATLARLLNDVRAALSAGARKARLPGDVLAIVREGLHAPEAPDRAREKQLLADDDARRLVEAAFAQDADFGALVLVLAATGCRFDQAARLTVADLQAGNQRILVPTSRKGRGPKARAHVAMPLPADVLARLRPLVAGRRGNERLLLRWHHTQVEGDKATGRLPAWVRTERRPWRTAAEMTRPWRAALTAAELPLELVPYALRHSAIVRGLRAGLPVRLVAAAHDTSIAMIEKHYAAFILDMSEDLLRRAAVPLAPAAPAEVRDLAAERAARTGKAGA
jgi:integrase